MELEFLGCRQLINHLYTRQFSDLLAQYELSQMEVDIILFFANNPQYDTASELVRIRHLTKSHVSSCIERLVLRGYLMKVPDEQNRRRIHLRLLPAVEPVVQAGRARQAAFAQMLFSGICPEEQAVFSSVLNRMIRNAKAACGAPSKGDTNAV